MVEYKYTKKTTNLEKDGFTILGKVKNEHCLKILPKGYEFINYKYSIKGCSLSTFHRDVTSSQYIFKTKHPIYTFARYLNTGPHLSVCPGSHKTVPFLFSNPYTVHGKKGDCYLFNCDLIHAGALHNFNNKRYMEQYKIAHIDDIKTIKNNHGRCSGSFCVKDLHNNYTEKKGDCNINKNYEIFTRKLSLHFSFLGNHILTKYLQKNQNNFFNKIIVYLNGRSFYNNKSK